MALNIKNKEPIIVLGAGHSGTRLVVKILTELGSCPGLMRNHWQENKLFNNLHKKMLAAYYQKKWDEVIFDINFLRRFNDRQSFLREVENDINKKFAKYYPDYQAGHWHWKCPTSALFMPTWLKIFPNAYYIHVERDKYDVAFSLMRRRQFYNPVNAIRFCLLMNARIKARQKEMQKYLLLDFHNLEKQIEKIFNFLRIEKNSKTAKRARVLIKRGQRPFWRKEYSAGKNLFYIYLNFVLGALKLAERLKIIKFDK